jgi:hypothetical protein
MVQIEHFFDCPYCGAQISMLLEPILSTQEYIEDCEVCCRPLNITYQTDGENLTIFEAQYVEQ